MKKNKDVKLKDTKAELNEILSEDKDFSISDFDKQEHYLIEHHHQGEDHYHGVHHFDKYGHHDDISQQEFTIRSQFPKSKKSLTFRIAMAALILGLAIAASAIDMLFEKFSININGVVFEMRILDLLVIVIGIPVVGLWGSIGIAIVEPWFHFLIDGDHSPIQILLDSFGYSLTVLIIFYIFYMLFKNSPIHKEPNKKKRLFKTIFPSIIIVPLCSIIFTGIFVLALYAMYKTGFKPDDAQDNPQTNWDNFMKNFSPIFFANFGVQLARFSIMYLLFVIIENAMKPINHRYR